MSAADTPALVFCSYSHRDDEFRVELEVHLAGLKRQNLIRFWSDRRITPGDEWKTEISAELEQADIILLLISSYFISSDYCFRIELGRALERHEQRTARVIPIIVRSCDSEGLPFAQLECLPPDAVPVSEARDHDKAWTAVATRSRRAREELHATSGMRGATRSGQAVQNYALKSYLQHLVLVYEKLPWLPGALTLTLIDAHGERHAANDTLYEWTRNDQERVLLLTGAAGSGKTSTLQALAARLAQGRLIDDTGAMPLFVRARSLDNASVDGVRVAVPEARAVIDQVLSSGQRTIVLLDGVDELLMSSAPTALGAFVQDFVRAFPSTSRFVISCRTTVADAIRLGFAAPATAPVIYDVAPLEEDELSRYARIFGVRGDTTLLPTRLPLILRLLDETW